jgi:2-polyprenyl-3-methyl-5-hydroxy-6-metoxy-1,4-benzoquinol methylase
VSHAICPLCRQPAEEPTRFKGIFYCGRDGDFEWFDRGLLDDIDTIKIYQDYPYNLAVEKDYPAMRPRYLRGLKNRILRRFQDTGGLSFLDVGCANGEYLSCARELGLSRVEGVEVDEKARAKASRFGAVATDLKEITHPFDVVQCKNVLSNIEQFNDFFVSLLNLIRPGGILFLDVLNQNSLSARIKKTFGRPGLLRPPFVINGFSKDSLKALAEKHLAKVIRLETTYCGSDLLPYKRTFSLTVRGRFSQSLGAGTMIIADIAPEKRAI